MSVLRKERWEDGFDVLVASLSAPERRRHDDVRRDLDALMALEVRALEDPARRLRYLEFVLRDHAVGMERARGFGDRLEAIPAPARCAHDWAALMLARAYLGQMDAAHAAYLALASSEAPGLWVHAVEAIGFRGLPAYEVDYAALADERAGEASWVARAWMLSRLPGDQLDAHAELGVALESELMDLTPHAAFHAYRALVIYHTRAAGFDRAWQVAMEWWKLAKWYGHPVHEAMALANVAVCEVNLGKVRVASERLERARGCLQGHDVPLHLNFIESTLAGLLFLSGRYRDALDVVVGVRARLEHLGLARHGVTASILRIYASWMLGERERAVSLWRAFLEDPARVGTAESVAVGFSYVCVCWYLGDLEEAHEVSEDLLASAEALEARMWQFMLTTLREVLLGVPSPDAQGFDFEDVPRSVRYMLDGVRWVAGVGPEPPADELERTAAGHLLRTLATPRRPVVELDLTARVVSRPPDVSFSLRRRQSLWEIVCALDAASPEPVSVERLFELGWPGQGFVDPDVAHKRVYWAVRELRRLGLEGVLVTLSPGYALQPG